MDLIAIKQYLKERGGIVPLKDVALHFRRDADAVRPLLEMWVNKGKVRLTRAEACGKGCCKCDPEHLELYEWVG